MGQVPTYDLRNNLDGGVSIKPGSAFTDAADATGTYVDCAALEGPIQALCQTGAISDASGQSINFELWESASSDGTGATKVATQTEVTLTADSSFGFLRGIRTKRYVAVKAESDDSSLATSESGSPSQEIAATILGQKKIV